MCPKLRKQKTLITWKVKSVIEFNASHSTNHFLARFQENVKFVLFLSFGKIFTFKPLIFHHGNELRLTASDRV